MHLSLSCRKRRHTIHPRAIDQAWLSPRASEWWRSIGMRGMAACAIARSSTNAMPLRVLVTWLYATTARGVGVCYTQKQIELPILHSYYMHNGYLSSYSVQRKQLARYLQEFIELAIIAVQIAARIAAVWYSYTAIQLSDSCRCNKGHSQVHSFLATWG